MKRSLGFVLTFLLAAAVGIAGESTPLKWSSNLLKKTPAWYASAEARTIADNILQYQSREGAWPKNTDLLAPASEAVLAEIQKSGKANTIDNGATTLPIRFLALAAKTTKEEKCCAAFLRGIDYVLASQYANGGFPQFYPLRKGYYSRITFNDGAMSGALELLRDIAEGREPFGEVEAARRALASEAVARGIDCTLTTQVRQNGRLTA